MLFLAVTVFLVCTGQIGAYVVDSQQANKLEEEIQELQDKMLDEAKKLDQISQDVDDLTKFSNKVDNIFSSYNSDEAEARVTQDISTSNKDIDLLPVTLKELRREKLPDNYVRYSARYVRNIDYRILVNSIFVGELEPDVISVEGDVEEASVTVKELRKNEKADVVFFLFFNVGETVSVSVEMAGPRDGGATVDETDSETIVRVKDTQVPMVRISPSTELVYQDGQDTNVTVFLSGSEEWNFLLVDEYLYDLDLNEIRSRYKQYRAERDALIIPNRVPRNVTGGREFYATLKTSEKRISGVLYFKGYADYSHSRGVLRSISVSKTVVLRPSDQPRAFPNGALGFFDSPYNRGVDADGADIRLCGIPEEKRCAGECEAYGEDIADLAVRRMLPLGTAEPVEDIITFGTENLKPVYFFASHEYGKTQKFRCIATSSNGAMVTKDILVIFVQYPKILENSTSAKLFENGNEKSVDLECGAWGNPLPNVTFSLHFTDGSTDDALPDDTSISLDGTEIFATKTMAWDDNVKGSVLSAGCSAVSEYGGYDYQRISIPAYERFLNDSMAEYLYLNFVV